MVEPLLLQCQSLDLDFGALGLLHGLELVGRRHGAGQGGRLGQIAERGTWGAASQGHEGNSGTVSLVLLAKLKG